MLSLNRNNGMIYNEANVKLTMPTWTTHLGGGYPKVINQKEFNETKIIKISNLHPNSHLRKLPINKLERENFPRNTKKKTNKKKPLKQNIKLKL